MTSAEKLKAKNYLKVSNTFVECRWLAYNTIRNYIRTSLTFSHVYLTVNKENIISRASIAYKFLINNNSIYSI